MITSISALKVPKMPQPSKVSEAERSLLWVDNSPELGKADKEIERFKKEKAAYDKEEKIYQAQKEILDSLNETISSINGVFEGEDKATILEKIKEKGLDIDEKYVDKFLKDSQDTKKSIESKKKVIETLEYNSTHNNTSGISYINDIAKAEVEYNRAQSNGSNKNEIISKIAKQKLINNIIEKNISSSDPKTLIDALEGLKFGGDFGKLQPMKNMNDEIKMYEAKVVEMSKEIKSNETQVSNLKDENKNLNESNRFKEKENEELKINNSQKDSKINELEKRSIWSILKSKIELRFKKDKPKELKSASNEKGTKYTEKSDIRQQLQGSVIKDVGIDKAHVKTAKEIALDPR